MQVAGARARALYRQLRNSSDLRNHLLKIEQYNGSTFLDNSGSQDSVSVIVRDLLETLLAFAKASDAFASSIVNERPHASPVFGENTKQLLSDVLLIFHNIDERISIKRSEHTSKSWMSPLGPNQPTGLEVFFGQETTRLRILQLDHATAVLNLKRTAIQHRRYSELMLDPDAEQYARKEERDAIDNEWNTRVRFDGLQKELGDDQGLSYTWRQGFDWDPNDLVNLPLATTISRWFYAPTVLGTNPVLDGRTDHVSEPDGCQRLQQRVERLECIDQQEKAPTAEPGLAAFVSELNSHLDMEDQNINSDVEMLKTLQRSHEELQILPIQDTAEQNLINHRLWIEQNDLRRMLTESQEQETRLMESIGILQRRTEQAISEQQAEVQKLWERIREVQNENADLKVKLIEATESNKQLLQRLGEPKDVTSWLQESTSRASQNKEISRGRLPPVYTSRSASDRNSNNETTGPDSCPVSTNNELFSGPTSFPPQQVSAAGIKHLNPVQLTTSRRTSTDDSRSLTKHSTTSTATKESSTTLPTTADGPPSSWNSDSRRYTLRRKPAFTKPSSQIPSARSSAANSTMVRLGSVVTDDQSLQSPYPLTVEFRRHGNTSKAQRHSELDDLMLLREENSKHDYQPPSTHG